MTTAKVTRGECLGHHRGLRTGRVLTGATRELGRANCLLTLRRYRRSSESEGIREGLLAVVADHSTAGTDAKRPYRVGGELKPKGPTVGKEKPGITFCLRETREVL